jgi:hypothetical protein
MNNTVKHTVKVRKDLTGQDLWLPLEDGRFISTEDSRLFETKADDTCEDDEFGLHILLDGIWTKAINIDFE